MAPFRDWFGKHPVPGEERQKLRQLWSHIACPPLWVTLLACVAILFVRKPDMFRNPQFWGEDGWFYWWARNRAGLIVFTAQYAGYLHTVPRLVAALATLADPRWAPAIFVATAFGFTLYVAARTQSSRCPLPRHAGCALAVVLVPDAFEVLLNITCLQWVLDGGLLLLLISADARRWWQHVHDVCVILLFGLTGPVSILLAPLFVWRAWYRRSPASCVLAALALTTGAVQAWTVWQNPTPVSDQPIAMDALLTVPGMRVAGSLLAGYFVPWDYPRAIETLLGIATLLAVVALAARQGVARLERTWLALVFVALLASALYRCRFVLPDLRHATFGSRYFFPLQLIVVWLVLAAATDARRWLARSAALLALWSLVINLPRLREPALTDFHWADYVGKLRAGEAVDVPVNPAPWVVTFPAKKP